MAECAHGFWDQGCHVCTPSAPSTRPSLAWTREPPRESGTYIYRRWSAKRFEFGESIHVEVRGDRAVCFFDDGKQNIPLERILRAKWLGEPWWFGPLPRPEFLALAPPDGRETP